MRCDCGVISDGPVVLNSFTFQVGNNNRPGNDAQTKEIEELKKKLATKTQDFGMSPIILCPLNLAIDDPKQTP